MTPLLSITPEDTVKLLSLLDILAQMQIKFNSTVLFAVPCIATIPAHAFVIFYSIVMSDLKGFNEEFILIDLTCDLKNCFIHIANVIVSSTPTSSASAEFFVSIFCFLIKIAHSHALMFDMLWCYFCNLDTLQMLHQCSKSG